MILTTITKYKIYIYTRTHGNDQFVHKKSNGTLAHTRDSLIATNTRKLGLTGGVVAYK